MSRVEAPQNPLRHSQGILLAACKAAFCQLLYIRSVNERWFASTLLLVVDIAVIFFLCADAWSYTLNQSACSSTLGVEDFEPSLEVIVETADVSPYFVATGGAVQLHSCLEVFPGNVFRNAFLAKESLRDIHRMGSQREDMARLWRRTRDQRERDAFRCRGWCRVRFVW